MSDALKSTHRPFSFENLQAASEFEQKARPYISRVGRFSDDGGLLRLRGLKQDMTFGQAAGKQTVTLEFEEVGWTGEILDWSLVFGVA